MKSALRILIAGWLALNVLIARAEIPDERVDQYMALSGIDEMLEALPRQIEVMVGRLLQASENPEAERVLMNALVGAWDPVATRASVEAYIQGASSPEEIGHLLDWKVTPLAKKVMAAEMESYQPEFEVELRHYTENLQNNPPDEQRDAAVDRLVKSAHLSELMVESSVQPSLALALVLLGAGMIDSKEALGDLHRDLEAMREKLSPQMEKQARQMSYYIYRNITDDELNRYAAYYETDLGKREVALSYGAMKAAMSRWSKDSAKTLRAGQPPDASQQQEVE